MNPIPSRYYSFRGAKCNPNSKSDEKIQNFHDVLYYVLVMAMTYESMMANNEKLNLGVLTY